MTATLTIDLGAIQDNWRLLDGMHAGETAGVVKADAYGLGAAKVGPALAAAGCGIFFTAHLAEAVALRAVLPDVRIGVLNGLFPHAAAAFYAHDLIPVLGSLTEVVDWRAAARALGRVLPCFLHLETGMHRLGMTAGEREVLAADKSLLDGLRLEYVITHLVAADAPGDAVNERQKTLFRELAKQFPGVKTSIGNSSGMFLGADFHTDLARPGAALYGVNPTPGAKNPMRHVVTLESPILQIHDVEPGESVGYSGVWRAERPSRIATIGVGYADGYHRALSNKATACFDDTPVPLVGRVSMDLTTFDVTDVDARPGDMLTLLGPRHDADALAAQAGTSGYEILTSLRRRFERRYIGGDIGA
jgi:alanine racemase